MIARAVPYVVRSFLGTPDGFATVAVRYAEGQVNDKGFSQ
jgi:hypothetical protein